ncbi:MAG: asparaginase [Gemmatimonadota bacterium]
MESVLEARPLDVLVLRGDVVESRHRAHAVVSHVDRSGAERIHVFGEPGAGAFWRSALKPFQALPVVEDGAAEAFGFTAEHLALACGSHGGRPEHVERVGEMMAAVDVGEAAIHCGPHAPYDEGAALAIAREGGRPRRLHNNCSGKHVAMLALAAHRGWEADGYWRFDHPLQRRIRACMARWIDSDPDELHWGTDGCGVPTPFLPLREMAVAYSRLARRAADGEAGASAVVGAMMRYPELTSSPGREALAIMHAGAGRLLAKKGAEGIMCAAAPADGWGVALKVEDGSRRAVGPALVAVLDRLGLLTDDERRALASLGETPLVSTTGETVGSVRAVTGARGGGAAVEAGP